MFVLVEEFIPSLGSCSNRNENEWKSGVAPPLPRHLRHRGAPTAFGCICSVSAHPEVTRDGGAK
ncbi:hypothetical protein EYF80_015669 [Liparis tanakae]|uniref:Uncharacterized protein n=1 Tax=Liparis tanakae TaxID=230148 RepID=A0A4Z2I7V4_9TELE|nr:hypothetical protein EYF80_015669 [Liparis tanakae]